MINDRYRYIVRTFESTPESKTSRSISQWFLYCLRGQIIVTRFVRYDINIIYIIFKRRALQCPFYIKGRFFSCLKLYIHILLRKYVKNKKIYLIFSHLIFLASYRDISHYFSGYEISMIRLSIYFQSKGRGRRGPGDIQRKLYYILRGKNVLSSLWWFSGRSSLRSERWSSILHKMLRKCFCQ